MFEKHRAFRFWVQKALPLVYDDSLSYYELLCKVVDYINNLTSDVNNMVNVVNEAEGFIDGAETQLQDVLDKGTSDFETAINNGNTAINTTITNANSNIANAIQELNTYRDNYFANLNVQEEINNKLDIMAGNGELGQIILNVFGNQLGHPWVVNSVSEMTGDTYLYILASTGELYQPQGSQGYVGTGFIYGGVNSFRILPFNISDSTNNVNLDNYNNYSCIKLIYWNKSLPVHSSFPGLTGETTTVVFKVINDGTNIVQELLTDNAHYMRTGLNNSDDYSDWFAIT